VAVAALTRFRCNPKPHSSVFNHYPSDEKMKIAPLLSRTGDGHRWLKRLTSLKLRFAILLAAVLSWMLLLPFIHGYFLGENLRHLLAIVTIIFAITVTVDTRRAVYLTLACALVSMVLNSQKSPTVHAASIALDIVLLVFACYRILRSVFSNSVVTSETLRAAVCLYLLLGVTFASAYFLGTLLLPDAVLQNNAPAKQMTDMIYLSFSTLTNLGYGDIRPNASSLRSIAMLEGISGQLFLTLLIARLVGIHTTQVVSNGNAGTTHPRNDK
jgi:voltage-gated potassium channel